GCALARGGHVMAALPYLKQAVEGNPFDRHAARALFQALGDTGDGFGQRRLAADQRLLAKAAPQVVPVEDWFAAVVSRSADSEQVARVVVMPEMKHDDRANPVQNGSGTSEARPVHWLGNQPPKTSDPFSEKGLASLLILCCNQLEYTRFCLESIF